MSAAAETGAPGAAAGPAPLSGASLWLAAVGLGLANFIVVLDTTIANVSVPHIAGGLAIAPTQGTWVITSYAVADAIGVPLTGWLAHRFGTVRLFTTALFGFGLFSLLCGMAANIEMLVLFRVLQGFSGGPLMALTQSLLMRIFPRDKASAGIGIWAMTTTLGPVLGPIFGGWISDNMSWRWIFFINLPIVGVCLLSSVRFLTPFETDRVRERIDVIGLMLLVAFVGPLQMMLDLGRDEDWFGSPLIVTLAIVSVISFAVFVIWELTDTHPVVDLRIFRHRGFTIGVTVIAVTFGAFFASIVLVPLWLQRVVGFTATDAGYVSAWVGVGAVMLAPVAAKLSDTVDLRVLVCGGVLWMGFTTLLRAGWTDSANYWSFALPQMLQGFGVPFYYLAATSLALGSVKASELTAASGLMNFARTLAGAIATALTTAGWDNASRESRVSIVGSLHDPDGVMASMQSTGMTSAQATNRLDNIVDTQALTSGALHMYFLAGVLFFFCAAAICFAPRTKPMSPGAVH